MREAAPTRRPEPRATYRLQLRGGVGFEEAAAVLPYLRDLGVSHVYLSPILHAAPGSTHGYDVIDPRHVDPDLGGDEALARFAEAAARHDLGLIVDIVPNHMAVGPENPWWWDVLANGPASKYAPVFDVEWALAPEPHLRERILLPVLGDHYGRVLEAGEFRLLWDGRAFSIAYHEQRFPVSARSLGDLVRLAADRAGLDELAWLADALSDLPPSNTVDQAARERRHRDAGVLLDRLVDLAAGDDSVSEAIDAVVATTNADLDALDRLLERQNYRLAWWRSARRDLGYRRFFDVTTLVGLRTEDPSVFDETHVAILRWLADGLVDGLRIDHPDGLRDPEGYLRSLRWAGPRTWLLVEKILSTGETLRRSWPVAGTTGYEWLNRITRLLNDPAGEEALGALQRTVTGEDRPFAEIAYEAKAEVLRNLLGSEVGIVTGLLLDVLERHRRHRDHTRHDLHEALLALAASLPVYRTYVRPSTADTAGQVAPEDEAIMATAISAAKEHRPDLPGDLFDVIGDLLLLRLPGELEAEFVARFQQLTGPATAKGVEDTAFYRDVRLLALDEVGGDPGRWAETAAEVHGAAARQQAEFPLSMLASSTHDTKRGEDVRARLLVLSAIPDRWDGIVCHWQPRLQRRASDPVDGLARALLLQTLVGAWPIERQRVKDYLVKALREARRKTSWADPDEAYEAAVADLVDELLEAADFVAELDAFVGEILVSGRINSLAQLLLKLTLPGVPDVYQGTELWDNSLVDPDNRRPVDFTRRARLLRELDGCTAEEVRGRLDDPGDPGLPKLWLLARTLDVRRRRPAAFGAWASYLPIDVAGASGTIEEPAFAFVRSGDDGAVAVVVPRPSAAPGRAVDESATLDLPAGSWRDPLGGGELEGGPRRLAELLARFPVALLERDPG